MTTAPTEAWRELRDRLRRFVGSRVKDPHAADDIAQDVLLKLQAHAADVPPEDTLPAWTIAVARNAVIDYYRARAVRDHADIADVEPAAETADADGDAVRDLSRCLSRMVEQLPEPYRQAMDRVDFEGVSLQELADRVGVSLSGVKSRVQRARQHLREMLRDCCDIERDGRGNVMDFERTERSGRYCGDSGGEPQCPR
jgi:RNA polymerase sigma-70 factor, ECF subfamily